MMELGQDWIHFKKFLHPKKRGAKSQDLKKARASIVIQNQNRVMQVISETDEIYTKVGAPLSEVLSQLTSEKKGAVIDRESLDRALTLALKGDRIFQQMEILKKEIKPIQGKWESLPQSFLLKSLEGLWGKVLPSQFGVYLRFEGNREEGSSRDFLILFKRGRVDQFDDPDLSSVSQDRQKDPEQVIKVLKERYGVPVQGFVMDRLDWVEWCGRFENGDHRAVWKLIAKALRQNRVQLAPFRWSVASMIGARAVFGL